MLWMDKDQTQFVAETRVRSTLGLLVKCDPLNGMPHLQGISHNALVPERFHMESLHFNVLRRGENTKFYL